MKLILFEQQKIYFTIMKIKIKILDKLLRIFYKNIKLSKFVL